MPSNRSNKKQVQASMAKMNGLQTFRTTHCFDNLGSGTTAEVNHVQARLADGTIVEGACKRLKKCTEEQGGPGQFRLHMKILTMEVNMLAALQDPAQHPSRAQCPHLPQVLAANGRPSGQPGPPAGLGTPGSAEDGPLMTEVLLEAGCKGSLGKLLKQRRSETPVPPTKALPQGEGSGAAGLKPTLLMDEVELWQIALAVAEGLQHVHQGGWLHGDVKPDNVVRCEDGRFMLIDFGMAQRLGTHASHLIGSQGSAAPEVTQAVHQGRDFTVTAKIDVYAFGCTLLWMLASWEVLLSLGLERDEVVKRIKTDGIANVLLGCNLGCPSAFKYVIKVATHPDRHKRASLAYVVNLIKTGLAKAQRRAARCAEADKCPDVLQLVLQGPSAARPAAAALPPICVAPQAAAPTEQQQAEQTPMAPDCGGTPASALQETPTDYASSASPSCFGSPLRAGLPAAPGPTSQQQPPTCSPPAGMPPPGMQWPCRPHPGMPPHGMLPQGMPPPGMMHPYMPSQGMLPYQMLLPGMIPPGFYMSGPEWHMPSPWQQGVHPMHAAPWLPPWQHLHPAALPPPPPPPRHPRPPPPPPLESNKTADGGRRHEYQSLT